MAEYRKGGVGALLDEYERALGEFATGIDELSDEDYVRVLDAKTEDEDCRTAQTIARHVIAAGYGYAWYLREHWGQPFERGSISLPERQEVRDGLRRMFAYNLETLADRHEMADEEITGPQIRVRWGPTYDIEQLLEHAVTHVLRHRRQIERLTGRPRVVRL